MPLSRRQIYRRRRLTVFGGIIVALAISFYLPLTLLAPLQAADAKLTPVATPTTTAAAITWPEYGASALGAVGFDGILTSGGSDKALPMASISKIITALVVLEAKPLDLNQAGPDITFTSADVALYNNYLALNGSLAPVHSGLVLTELQVLQLTLVHSANNYTGSLVNWAFGSTDAFVPVAQAWLKEHNLDDTTFIEPTGIDPTNTSTAADLVELGKLAIANPVIDQLVSTATISIPGVGDFDNTNALLGVDGVTGLKTGTLDTFGANLLFSAEYPVGTATITVVGVVLGGKTHPALDDDIQVALKEVAAGFQQVTLTTKGEKLGSYSTAWGTSNLVAAEDSTALVWSDTAITAAVVADPVALGAKGKDVGEVTFSVGSTKVEVPLELSSAVADPGPAWRLTHPAELF